MARIYCSRRNGSQLNLETWYGGRCHTTRTEEKIGFGDIIILDLKEQIQGPPPEESVTHIIEIIQQIFNGFTSGRLEDAKKLAYLDASNPDGGLISVVSHQVSNIFKHPPASSLEYLAYVRTNLAKHHLVQPAYAQTASGYGFTALEPLLPVWRTFRNITYFFYILGFIIYGFMIMFRMKVSSQAVASIESALPKLVITLLLITFSYAIAGLMIDIFYLLIGVLFSVFQLTHIINSSGHPQIANIVSGRYFGLLPSMLVAILYAWGGLIGAIISGILGIPETLGTIINIALFIIPTIGIIISLILSIAIVFTYIHIWWMLIQAYINIILNVIFAPVIILGNILPGSNSFGTWVKNLAAEISVFAATMIMLLLSFFFMAGGGNLASITGINNIIKVGDPVSTGHLWRAPPLGVDWGPQPGGNYGRMAIIGLGMLFMTPKLADMVRKSLKVSQIGFGSGFGEVFTKGPAGVIVNPAMKAGEAAIGRFALQNVGRLLPGQRGGAAGPVGG